MSSVKTNERELTSKISQWLNEIIQRGKYPFGSASNETGIDTDTTTKFGDLIIWEDRETAKAYTYIEIKPPFGAKENLRTFEQKAVELKIKYAFTWNFQNLRVFKIEKNKAIEISVETESILSKTEDWVRGDVQAKIKAYLVRFLNEVVNLHKTGKLTRFQPDKVYFVNFLRKAVKNLIPHFEKHYRDASRKTENKSLIAAYAHQQGIAFSSNDDYHKLIANQSVYALVTKIIFYLTIRRHFDELPDLLNTEEEDSNKLLRYAFAKARQRDWQAVFEEDAIEKLGLPKAAYDDIQTLLSEMQVYHFGDLAEDVIGEIFEEIIDPEERHRLGQYFTNEDLVDLIIGFAVNNENGFYGDPTCGSGTFLIRLYDRLRFLSSNRLKHSDLLNQVWGIDIGKFPAELSTINLFRQSVKDYANFPRVLNEDVFNIRKGMTFRFPPSSFNKNFDKIDVALPEFDAFVGNFPYIRQEIIEKKDRGYKKKLTKIIAYEYLLSYPKLFITKLKETHFDAVKNLSGKKFVKQISDFVEKGFIDLRLSGQADIYAYIFLHTATMLKENGRLAIITSNSWLDVSYGSVLKEFFLDNFKIIAVIASWAEPWFEDAAVNTVVTIVEKGKPSKEDKVKFVKLKKKLEDLISERDLKLASFKRWRRIDGIVNFIETAEFQRDVVNVTDKISSIENDEMRIRIIPQSELKGELTEKSGLAKWGKYLRAPDVYFEILDKAKEKLVPLKDIATVRRGYTTGINEFFYLEEIKERKPSKKNCAWYRNARGWEGEIEKKYLKPVIKSPKESQSIIIDPKKLKFNIFICNKNKSELKRAGDIGALKYIEWGEKQRTKQNIPWTEVPSVKGRKYWWGITEKQPGPILFQMINNDRFVSFLNETKVHVDHNLFELLITEKELYYQKFYFNSFVFALIKEVNSRVNLGDGATKTEGVDWSNLMLAPQIPLNIILTNSNILQRKVFSVFEEIKQKDRQELDVAVLEALGLNPEEYLSKIYEGITELVKERLQLPKMRKKKKQTEKKKAFVEIKKYVEENVIPNGIKSFPEGFYFDNYESLEVDIFQTNGKPLKGEQLFNHIDMKDEEGKIIFELDSEIKAEFAEILSRKEAYQIKIPKDERIVDEILTEYKNYVKQLEKDLEAAAYEASHDWAESERIAKEIMSEWGISLTK